METVPTCQYVSSSPPERLTTPETQPGLPLSHVSPCKAIGSALSQQNVPAGRSG